MLKIFFSEQLVLAFMQARLALSWVDPRKYRHCASELTDRAYPTSFSSLETVVNVADARPPVVPGLCSAILTHPRGWKLRMRIMRERKNSRIMPALCSLLLKTNYAQNYAGIIFAPLLHFTFLMSVLWHYIFFQVYCGSML